MLREREREKHKVQRATKYSSARYFERTTQEKTVKIKR